MTYKLGEDGFYSVPLVDFGNRLQDNFGLRVREHSAFGGVSPVHAPNSYHKYDEAIDITDWRSDSIDGVDWKTRTGNLQNLLKGAGPEVIGPNSGDPNHSTHLHLAATDGILKLTPEQYNTFFGGNAGGKNATFGSFVPGADAQPVTVDSDNPSQTTPQQEAVERVQQYKANTAKDVVDNFGNDFGSMKSQGLAKALAGAQESIIQKRMDGGEMFGGRMVEVEKPKKDDESGK